MVKMIKVGNGLNFEKQKREAKIKNILKTVKTKQITAYGLHGVKFEIDATLDCVLKSGALFIEVGNTLFNVM